MIQALIFDCFGVLIGKGFRQTYILAGGNAEADKQFIQQSLVAANQGLIDEAEFEQRMIKQLGISRTRWHQVVDQAELPDVELLNYIKQLRKKYKTAILSNAMQGVLERMLGQTTLTDCFDVVVVSAEEGLIKPDKRIYEITAQRLGVSLKECLFVDDKPQFIEVAKSVGMKGIIYQDFKQFKRDLASNLKS